MHAETHKYLQNEPFSPASLLFTTNFLDFSKDEEAVGGIIWLWLIASYVQIMLFTAFLLSFRSIRSVLRRDTARAVVAAFLISVAVKFGLVGLFDPNMLVDRVPLHTRWNYLPTTHLATVILGGIVYLAAAGGLSRWLCLVLGVGYAVLVGAVFDANRPELLVLAILLIVFLRSIPLPFALYRVVLWVSGASLYIYLLHNPILSLVRKAGIEMHPMGYFILIVSGIVVGGMLLERGYRAVRANPALGIMLETGVRRMMRTR